MGYKALVHHRINQRLTGRFLNVDELQQWSGRMLMEQGMQFDWKFSDSSPPLLTHVMEACPPSTPPLPTPWKSFASALQHPLLLIPHFRTCPTLPTSSSGRLLLPPWFRF